MAILELSVSAKAALKDHGRSWNNNSDHLESFNPAAFFLM